MIEAEPMNQYCSDQLGYGAERHLAGKWLALLVLLLLLWGWTAASHAQDCPRELPVDTKVRSTPLTNNQLFTLHLGEDTRQLLMHWDDFSSGSDTSGDPPAIVHELVQAITQSMGALKAQGFRLPRGAPHPCVTGHLIRVYWYASATARAAATRASGNRIDVTYSPQAIRQGTVLQESLPGLLYELVRLVQKQYRLGAVNRGWLHDGTARLVAEALGSNDLGKPTAADRSCQFALLQIHFNRFFLVMVHLAQTVALAERASFCAI